jgi:magnesium transporter
VIKLLRCKDGRVESPASVDPAWLAPDDPGVLWVDLCDPTPEESRLLTETFKFHELAIEDALAASHHPKAESYGGYLYLILHGINFHAAKHVFATIDTDFFVGKNYLVTVRHGQTRSIPYVRELCEKNGAHVMQEGPFALAHRIIDKMVDHYRPEVDELAENIDQLEKDVFENPDAGLIRVMLDLKRDVASLRRVVLPQRDVVGRLARREFPEISESVAYRFRDVFDHLVRLTDEAIYFQDRISGLLEANLSNVSNRLNQVMKVLTLIATVFMPMTVLTGIWGMNVDLPQLPGGHAAQFWWIVAMLIGITAWMVWLFRTRKWF